jgi:uncharacterized NAD(P)/FAD-binding protein YdhS
MFQRIAIIGGGAAAAALLSELVARQPGPGLHIDWYTSGDAQARGIAYSTQSDRHLLNVRAASMGMFSGQPQGFLDYARTLDASVAGTDFLPRRLYGDYLQSEVVKALQCARDTGTDVQLVPFHADALVPEAGAVTVIQGEDSRRVDAAVLAIGALPPQPLPGVDPAALASGRYITSPWSFLNRLELDEPPAEVLLVGLGLTAIDVLLELSARWPQTRFTTVSRHGLPPEAHRAKAAAPQDDGGQLVEAMRDAPAIRAWLALLREAIGQSSDWRTVIDSLRPHTPGLWQSLPKDEQARFLRHARWAWERARHRMPPQVASSIQALEADGRLRRRRGRVRQVELDGQRLAVQLRPSGRTAGETLHADLVIQTIGLNTDVRQTPHPLISQLRTNGHIEADPLGLGLRAQSDGRLCRGAQPWPNLFAIGSLLRGRLWESTAMPEIRQQARNLAEHLLAP